MESGASYKHFVYLLNGSIILHRLSPSDRNKVAWGTTGNEALHNQIKGVASTTVQQHATRVCTRMKAFAIGKMLTHNVAAYSPSTHKQIEGDVLCTIQGALTRSFFPAFGMSPVPAVTSRKAARAAVGLAGPINSAAVKGAKLARVKAWKKEKALRRKKDAKQPWRQHRKGLGMKKRTVFTRVKKTRGKRRQS